MGLKALLAAAAGVGVLVGGLFGYRTWARAKGISQLTHPDIVLGHTGDVSAEAQAKRTPR